MSRQQRVNSTVAPIALSQASLVDCFLAEQAEAGNGKKQYYTGRLIEDS